MSLKMLKKFFTTFSIVGAAILTWLSIIAAPPLWDIIKPKRADIVVAPLECDIKQYCFMVSNVGNRAAVLTDIYAFLKESPGTMYILQNNYKNEIIKPDEVLVIKSLIDAEMPTMLPYELHRNIRGNNIRKNCKARFQFIQHSSVEESTEVDFFCFDESFKSKPSISHNQ